MAKPRRIPARRKASNKPKLPSNCVERLLPSRQSPRSLSPPRRPRLQRNRKTMARKSPLPHSDRKQMGPPQQPQTSQHQRPPRRFSQTLLSIAEDQVSSSNSYVLTTTTPNSVVRSQFGDNTSQPMVTIIQQRAPDHNPRGLQNTSGFPPRPQTHQQKNNARLPSLANQTNGSNLPQQTSDSPEQNQHWIMGKHILCTWLWRTLQKSFRTWPHKSYLTKFSWTFGRHDWQGMGRKKLHDCSWKH